MSLGESGRQAGDQFHTGPLAWLPSVLRRSKLMAPDFERLARSAVADSLLGISGTRLLSSALAFSCSR